jgi:hypothetical protein
MMLHVLLLGALLVQIVHADGAGAHNAPIGQAPSHTLVYEMPLRARREGYQYLLTRHVKME